MVTKRENLTKQLQPYQSAKHAQAVVSQIAATEEFLEHLKRMLWDASHEMHAEIKNEDDLRAAGIYLYWTAHRIPEKAIAEFFLRCNANELAGIVGKLETDIKCTDCGGIVAVNSREHLQGLRDTSRSRLCPSCWEKFVSDVDALCDKDELAEREQIVKLRSMPYADYLGSPEWRGTGSRNGVRQKAILHSGSKWAP